MASEGHDDIRHGKNVLKEIVRKAERRTLYWLCLAAVE